MPEQHYSRSERETFEVARALALSTSRPAHFLLYGDLGSGKTAFARGLVAGFGADPEEVSSPTFTLVNRYSGESPIFHVDLYRIDSGDLLGLDLEQAFDDPTAVVIVEWAERLGLEAPEGATEVWLEYVTPSERAINVQVAAPNR